MKNNLAGIAVIQNGEKVLVWAGPLKLAYKMLYRFKALAPGEYVVIKG